MAKTEVTSGGEIELRESRERTLFAAMSGLGFQSMSTMLLSYVLATMIAEFGLSSAAGGFISTVTNIGMLVGGIIFGTLADRYGRARMFAVTVALFSLACGATAFATDLTLVYFFRFLVGVGGGGEYGVIMAMVADAFDSKKRGRVNSYVTISGQVGSIVAAVAVACSSLALSPLFSPFGRTSVSRIARPGRRPRSSALRSRASRSCLLRAVRRRLFV